MRQFVSVAKTLATCAVCLPLLFSCKARGGQTAPADEIPAEEQVDDDPILSAVDRFLVEEFGPQYSQGDVCIPCSVVMDVEDVSAEETLVSGNFLVFNYILSGDTLKTVSGGSHPGIMHVRMSDGESRVVSFDAVGDGSAYEPSARRLFGDRYESFQELVSDDLRREAVRSAAVTDYVSRHKLPVSMYQDYGWDPVRIGDRD